MEGSRRHARIIGRETELAGLLAELTPADAPRFHVVSGASGIGKTTLWEAALESLAEEGATVLRTRASEAEAQLSFAGLADLLAGVADTALAPLPDPQAYALAVALHRRSPDEGPPEDLAVSLGFLNVLTALAGSQPLVVAVDDVQWLDRVTTDVLGFAIRRLEGSGAPIRFLVAHRTGTRAPLLEAIGGSDRHTRSVVQPLSAGAVRRMLHERLGLSLTRRDLHRLHDVAQGNPLFALELGRATLARGEHVPEGDLAVPENVEHLLGTRVSRLPAEQRRLLVATAICPALAPSEVHAIAGPQAIDDATDAGLVTVEENRIRPAHPLLAAAALEQTRARERRAIHAALAEAVTDEQLRAKLLAGASTRADDAVAETIARAAAGAEQLGAFDDAVALTAQALRLTPSGSPARPARVLLYGRLLAVTGQPGRTVELFLAELGSLPEGPLRGQALVGLASETTDPVDVRRYLDRALSESCGDRGVRAAATAILGLREAVIELRDVPGAEARVSAVLPDAELAGPELAAEITIDLLWINALRGHSVAEAMGRFPSLAARRVDATPIPEMIDAQRHSWRGEIADARQRLGSLVARTELGPRFYALNRLYLCELELRCGRYGAAARLLAEWDESSDDEFAWPMYERCRAQLAAGRGQREETERWVAAALEKADATGEGWNRLEAVRARGLAALCTGDVVGAVRDLRHVWDHTESEGIDEPGVFPAGPDLVEALCEAREHDAAAAVAARLRLLGDRLGHPWALLAARRSYALIALTTDDGEGVAALEDVAAACADAGLQADRARCLLALGRVERRRRQWAAARSALDRAADAFDDLDAPGWAGQARSELERVGARRPAPEGGLTPSEGRAAALAAEGLANKEIAARLHVSVHTVEVHLSRAYAKLGVRSRTQLAARLLAEES